MSTWLQYWWWSLPDWGQGGIVLILMGIYYYIFFKATEYFRGRKS